MLPSMASEPYEAMSTLRSEMFDKKEGFSTLGRFDGPRGVGGGWMTGLTPAERDVFMKYQQQGKQRAALGGLLGASAMAGVWKLAPLRRGMGIAGVIVGAVVGARVSMSASDLRR